ncbi:MAG: TRAP transporter small permease subunit [Gammaproteobacteria bacterium]
MSSVQPSPQLIRTVRFIDGITDFIGNVVAWLIIPLVGAVAYEVISRYLFHQPTTWSFDVTYMLYGTLFMLAAAYALHKGAHIRTDFLWDKFSVRTKGLIDTLAYILFFFPGLLLFLYSSWDEAWQAFLLNERSDITAWRPLLWPFKAVVPLTAVLLMFQGVSELLKSLYALRTGIELEHKEKVEV